MSRNPPKTGSQRVLPYRLPSTVIPTGPGNLWIRLIIIVQLTEANLPRGNSEFYRQTRNTTGIRASERGMFWRHPWNITIRLRSGHWAWNGHGTTTTGFIDELQRTARTCRRSPVFPHIRQVRFDVSLAFLAKVMKKVYTVWFIRRWHGLKLGLTLREVMYVHGVRGFNAQRLSLS